MRNPSLQAQNIENHQSQNIVNISANPQMDRLNKKIKAAADAALLPNLKAIIEIERRLNALEREIKALPNFQR